jgi:hypothetical protein
MVWNWVLEWNIFIKLGKIGNTKIQAFPSILGHLSQNLKFSLKVP